MDIYKIGSRTSRAGFSLIELIVTISVVAIIAGATTAIVAYITQLLIYTPREARARTIAHDIMETIIEGHTQKRGIRYATQVVDASSTQVTYTFGYPGNGDKRNMRFSFNSNKIELSYTAFGDPVNGTELLSYRTPPELVSSIFSELEGFRPMSLTLKIVIPMMRTETGKTKPKKIAKVANAVLFFFFLSSSGINYIIGDFLFFVKGRYFLHLCTKTGVFNDKTFLQNFFPQSVSCLPLTFFSQVLSFCHQHTHLFRNFDLRVLL